MSGVQWALGAVGALAVGAAVGRRGSRSLAAGLRLWHGTNTPFTGPFELRGSKGPSRLGLFFTDDPEMAQNFGDHLIEAVVTLRRPKQISHDAWNRVREAHGGRDDGYFSRWREELIQKGHDGLEVLPSVEQIGRFEVRNPRIVAAFFPESVQRVENP